MHRLGVNPPDISTRSQRNDRVIAKLAPAHALRPPVATTVASRMMRKRVGHRLGVVNHSATAAGPGIAGHSGIVSRFSTTSNVDNRRNCNTRLSAVACAAR